MSSARLYPTIPRARTRTILLDVAVLLGVLVFAWAGMQVHDGVAELSGLGRGLQDAGSAVEDTGSTVGGALRDGFGGAAGAVGGAPVIGGTLEGALRDAGDDAGGTVEQAGADSGGQVAAAGRDGERKAYHLANLLGWGTFLLPTLWLLSRFGPSRVRAALGWTAADRVFGAAAPPADALPAAPAAAAPSPAPSPAASPPAAPASPATPSPTGTGWSSLSTDTGDNLDHPAAEPPQNRAGTPTGAPLAAGAVPPPPGADTVQRRRVLAERAMHTLPYRDLLHHTADPVGDLLAGRFDGLLSALADADGVDARRKLALA